MTHTKGATRDEDSDSDFDMGQAGEGVQYTVEEEVDGQKRRPAAQPAAVTNGPEDQQTAPQAETVTSTDPDSLRAAALRAKQVKLQKTAATSSGQLPFIPGSGRPRTTVVQPAARRRPVRSCPQRWRLGLRACMHWDVLKHVLAAMVIPTLAILGFIFWLRMPADISFSQALIRGDMTTVKWYLDTEHMSLNDVIEGDVQKRTPMHLAALGNSTILVKHLVFRGALLDLQDDNGFTALHYAANNQNYELTDFLVSQGVPVDMRDVNGRSALHIASISGSVPVMAVLVFNGNADLKAVDADKYLAVDYSRVFHESSMQKLLDGGYYHDADGKMQVISHDKFTAMRTREGVPGYEKSKKSTQPKKKRKGKKQPVITIQAKEDPPRASPTDASTPAAAADEDDFMSLFTGESEPTVANARYQRAAASAAASRQQQRDAVDEYEDLLETGRVDSDEFEM